MIDSYGHVSLVIYGMLLNIRDWMFIQANCNGLPIKEKDIMLVVSRKVGEAFQVGDDVRLKITGVQFGRRSGLGIAAPEKVSIYLERLGNGQADLDVKDLVKPQGSTSC